MLIPNADIANMLRYPMHRERLPFYFGILVV